MNGSYHTVSGVAKENRYTVGRPYSYRDTGKIRNKSIISLQILPCHIRPIYDSDLRTVYLMALNDRIRQDRISPGSERLYTRAEEIMKERLRQNVKIGKMD